MRPYGRTTFGRSTAAETSRKPLGRWFSPPSRRVTPESHDGCLMALVVFIGIGVLCGSIAHRRDRLGILSFRNLLSQTDDLDFKAPFVAVVIEEQHLAPNAGKCLSDLGALHTPGCSTTVHVCEEFIPHRRLIDISGQLAKESVRMV